jgi:hypothetical protein
MAEAHLACAVFFFGSSFQMALAVLLGAIGIGWLLVSLAPLGAISFGPSTLTCLLTGMLVGVAVRNRFVASCERRRSYDSSNDVRLHLALAVGMIVLLFPTSDIQASFAPAYATGVGLGFFLHFLTRRADQRAARQLKLARAIKRELQRLGTPALDPVEVDAIRLFAGRRWRRLRTLFNHHADALTFRLALVKATAERVQGNDAAAIETLMRALGQKGRANTSLDCLAHILVAMCHRDLGNIDETWQHLAMAEELEPRCLLHRSFKALCLAEQLPNPGQSRWSEYDVQRIDAKQCIEDAFAMLREPRKLCPLERVVACALPLTRRFMDDTLRTFR